MRMKEEDTHPCWLKALKSGDGELGKEARGSELLDSPDAIRGRAVAVGERVSWDSSEAISYSWTQLAATPPPRDPPRSVQLLRQAQ